MNQNLYFKTDKFDSIKALAEFMHLELTNLSLNPEEAVDSDYMFFIKTNIEGDTVDIFMGKNDEEVEIPLWQIWPEQRVPFLKKIFGRADRSAEFKVKEQLETIIKNIDDVSAVEWGI